jgi:hypothetical protein
MAVCCRERKCWDNGSVHRLPDTYANCNLVEGPDARSFSSLVYVDHRGTNSVTRAGYGCIQVKRLWYFAEDQGPRPRWQGPGCRGE